MIFLLLITVHSQGCYQLEGHLCVNNQAVDLELDSLPQVLGQWFFEKGGYDLSMNMNVFESPELGPGRGSVGNSAYYNGNYYSEIPHIDAYDNIVTVSMWLYPLSSQSQFTTIFRKASSSTEYTPTILLWPFSDEANVGGGQIEVIVSTSYDKESIRSRGSITGRKWSQLTVVIQGLSLSLYINGNLDCVLSLKARPIHNNGPIYLGGDPWFSGPLIYIDDLILYDTPFLQLEINKIAALPGQINQGLFYLGCDGCNYHQAINSCKFSYHLCSLSEITAGIYQYARQQGWLRLTRDFWSRLDEIDKEASRIYLDPGVSKAGICCYDQFSL